MVDDTKIETNNNAVVMTTTTTASSSSSNTTNNDATTSSNYYKSSIPLIAGFTAGTVSTTLLLPLDIIKLRLQVNESTTTTTTGKQPQKRPILFRSLRIMGGILKYEGVFGLYQGWTPAVLGSAISWGGYFYFYEGFKQKLVQYKLGDDAYQQFQGKASDVLGAWDNFVLAVAAGGVMVAMTNPVWLVKTRMQLQMKRAGQQHHIQPYNSMVDAFRTIVKEEGPLALYKGAGTAFLLTSHGGVQFVVYEFLRKRFHDLKKVNREEGKEMSVWKRLQFSTGFLLMGAASKLAATTVTYPLQLVKTRIQQRANSVELTDDGQIQVVKREYNGIRNTVTKIYRQEGVAGFFKGCIPNAVRVLPGAAVTFVVYEEVSDLLN